MDGYIANGTQNVVTPGGATALTLVGHASKRGKIYYAMCGAGGAPADNNIRWRIRRFTTAGTGTAVTLELTDPAAPAGLLTAFQNHSAEPTYAATTGAHDLPIHQRTTWQWYYPPGTELIIPASATQGIGATPSHASYNTQATATFHWTE